jgi:hypothetical protein
MLLDTISSFYFPSINEDGMATMRTGEVWAMWEPVHMSIVLYIYSVIARHF